MELFENESDWQRFVDRFKLDLPGSSPWNAQDINGSFPDANEQDRHSIQFLLNVWDPDNTWPCGRCDLMSAMRAWDRHHKDAVLDWLRSVE